MDSQLSSNSISSSPSTSGKTATFNNSHSAASMAAFMSFFGMSNCLSKLFVIKLTICKKQRHRFAAPGNFGSMSTSSLIIVSFGEALSQVIPRHCLFNYKAQMYVKHTNIFRYSKFIENLCKCSGKIKP